MCTSYHEKLEASILRIFPVRNDPETDDGDFTLLVKMADFSTIITGEIFCCISI